MTPNLAIRNSALDQTRAAEYGRRVLREKMADRHTNPEVRPSIRRIINRLREIR
jgi:hypothetical protein